MYDLNTSIWVIYVVFWVSLYIWMRTPATVFCACKKCYPNGLPNNWYVSAPPKKSKKPLYIGLSFAVTVVLFIFSIPDFEKEAEKSDNSSSSSDSSSSVRVVTPQQLYEKVKGCCSGAGGTYSPALQDCIIDWDNQRAFTSCVDKGKVKYPNGNVHSYSGSEFVR